MHSMSPSSLDMPVMQSGAANKKNQRQSVDSLNAQANDDQSFKNALEKSQSHKQDLEEIQNKSDEKANNNSKINTSENNAYSIQQPAVSKGSGLESRFAQLYEPDTEINESVLIINNIAHNTMINGQAYTGYDIELNNVNGISEGIEDVHDNENNILLKDFSRSFNFSKSTNTLPDESIAKTLGGSFLVHNIDVDLNQKIVSGFALEQALSVLPAITNEGESNTKPLLNNPNSLIPQNSLISQQSLTTSQPLLSESNESLILGQQTQSAITLNTKSIDTQNPHNLPQPDAGLTHQKINSQLSSLMSKGQADSSSIELSTGSQFLPDSNGADIHSEVLTASERAEQRLTMANADKMVVSTNIKVGMPGWADQIAERTASLVSQNIKQAEIQLNPQEMGAINVKISINQDQVAVTFTAQNSGVREALDQSVQRLRDALGSEGMDLVQADVGGQSAQSDESAAEQAPELAVQSNEDDSELNNIIVDIPSSGIDQFA